MTDAPTTSISIRDERALDVFASQHFLYFRPLPQGHWSLRPGFAMATPRLSWPIYLMPNLMSRKGRELDPEYRQAAGCRIPTCSCTPFSLASRCSITARG